MSIRHSLLAILDLGACYGYQLRLEYERRSGATTPLNVGQVYSTLDRLERDGLATKAATDDAGHVYYAITAAGSAEAATWLVAPSGSTDEFARKLALALTLPAADAAALIAAQRESTTTALDGYRAEPGDSVQRRLVLDARESAALAELRWLDRIDSLVAEAVPFGLDAELPKRGRPARA
jgi:DNA-binding PadR family transcriptional regulator